MPHCLLLPSSYELMLQCWQLEPSLRPAPHNLVAQLTPADSIFDDADSELNAERQVGSNKSDSTGSGPGNQSCKAAIAHQLPLQHLKPSPYSTRMNYSTQWQD